MKLGFAARSKGVIRDDSLCLVKELIEMTRSLPPIAEKTYITLNMEYHKNVPDDFHPEHFAKMPDNLIWTEKFYEKGVGSIVTNYHRLDMNYVCSHDVFEDMTTRHGLLPSPDRSQHHQSPAACSSEDAFQPEPSTTLEYKRGRSASREMRQSYADNAVSTPTKGQNVEKSPNMVSDEEKYNLSPESMTCEDEGAPAICSVGSHGRIPPVSVVDLSSLSEKQRKRTWYTEALIPPKRRCDSSISVRTIFHAPLRLFCLWSGRKTLRILAGLIIIVLALDSVGEAGGVDKQCSLIL